MNDKKIKLIRQCEWEEVFLEWYKSEGESVGWQELAAERGYASWAEWRLKGYAEHFDCRNAQWAFYEISDPAEVILNWFGGPFRNWIEKYYDGEKTKTFAELAIQPHIMSHGGIKSIMAEYPKDSMITALELADGRIFVVEGSHRSCALALMAKDKSLAPEKLIFAIGKSKLSELPPVENNSFK
jgi:hypothetical protein